jgi:hypothetical protein
MAKRREALVRRDTSPAKFCFQRKDMGPARGPVYMELWWSNSSDDIGISAQCALATAKHDCPAILLYVHHVWRLWTSRAMEFLLWFQKGKSYYSTHSKKKHARVACLNCSTTHASLVFVAELRKDGFGPNREEQKEPIRVVKHMEAGRVSKFRCDHDGLASECWSMVACPSHILLVLLLMPTYNTRPVSHGWRNGKCVSKLLYQAS